MKLDSKSVVYVAHAQRRSMSDGLTINQIHPSESSVDLMDPFLAIDSFQMSQPFFAPHPHAGLNAVTYILPDSPEGFINRDSLGNRDFIEPGSLHWTAAGAGMMHEEVPRRPGVVANGLQLFVNLAAADKLRTPEALHLSANNVPIVEDAGSTTRVVVGIHNTVSSPLPTPTDVTILFVTLDAGATWMHHAPHGESRFLVALSGSVTIAGSEINADDSLFWSTEGETAVVSNLTSTVSRFVVAGGRPLREPVVFDGPFCMTTQAQIDDAIARYRAGAMGHLERSF